MVYNQRERRVNTKFKLTVDFGLSKVVFDPGGLFWVYLIVFLDLKRTYNFKRRFQFTKRTVSPCGISRELSLLGKLNFSNWKGQRLLRVWAFLQRAAMDISRLVPHWCFFSSAISLRRLLCQQFHHCHGDVYTISLPTSSHRKSTLVPGFSALNTHGCNFQAGRTTVSVCRFWNTRICGIHLPIGIKLCYFTS